ncbi:non-ribosomal peptide synthetase, partial [Myxococcus sp. RHSTA-1-4]|uniref:non-ribosomal peptide synthetase n=1 Tax=Myxococcus sp. RHSTA-1-4 TaxID=2874601 RepID=UPI001CC05D61
GRADAQVKVRGYRIELAEVEAALLALPGVAQAVVLAREDVPGDKRLVGYVVPAPGIQPDLAELRASLAKRLPEYMVPSALVRLDALPLTANSKVDRKALPAPDADSLRGAAPFVAPRTPLEQALAEQFAQVLGVQRVSVTDDFFALGGHSLLATRLATSLRESLGVDLPLRTLFETPTVEALASRLEQARQAAQPAVAAAPKTEPKPWSPLVPLRAGDGARRPLYLVHPLDGRLHCYAELVEHAPKGQPILGFQARGLDDGRAPFESVDVMAAFYVEALRAAQPEGPYLLAGWALGGAVAWEMAQQLQREGLEAKVALIEPTPTTPDAATKASAAAAQAGHFARDLARQAGMDELPLPTSLTTGKDAEPLLQHLHAEGVKSGLLPEGTSLDEVRARFKMFASHLRAARRYVPEPYSGPVRILRASEAPDLEDGEKDRGWGELAESGVEVEETPGDGYSLLRAPHVKELAPRLFGATGSEPPTPGTPGGGGDGLPLSFAQQRLWFMDQFQPGSPAYNIFYGLRFTGPMDHGVLERAFAELVRRHHALRTTFRNTDHGPVQVVTEPGAFSIPLEDLHALPAEQREAEARRLAGEEARRPFNLATGPLLRARLLTLDAQDHVLVLVIHHIVSDGWSMGILVQELTALYLSFLMGQPSPLPELPVQYPDYAVWQRGWLQGEVLEKQLAYWRRQLAGAPEALELPTDRPRPAMQTHNGALRPIKLSRALSDALNALCRREGATPFMALLAAFQVLLSRYSRQDDVVVGSPIAGRTKREHEGLIGFFVNTLVMRTRLGARDSFRDVLRQVKESALGVFAHQDVPFEKLVDELKLARDTSRSPLFQVLFALQNAPTSGVKMPGLALRPLEVTNATVKFELELNLGDSPEGYQGSLGYNTDLFEPATIDRMAEHFRTLVGALVSRPEAPLASVSLLSQAERKQVLVDWNATASEYPRGSTLPEVFSQVVARLPDKVAVEFGDAKLTYRQLDERANQLAWHLRGLGVSTDSRVAIALERSLELIVSLVAILKAGGAYVPLDPSYPRERLAAMVEDSRPRVLITTRQLLAKLPGVATSISDEPALPTSSELNATGLAAVVLEEVSLEGQPTSAPPLTALPNSLAYIDFTSGSTGRPKGVGTPQSAVLRTVFGVDYAHLGPDETFLLIAPVSFDASTLELWGPLLHGARLVVFPPHSPSDLKELESVLTKHAVTTLHLTSGLFTQVVDHNFAALRGVKQLLTGGDVVSAPHVRRVLEELRIPVTACYGPTESTLFASCHRMTDVAHVGASVPIGRPIGNTQVYLLDASGQPVPVGVTGELFIGGDGVARGYVEQPALTAERFVPDAFSGVPGARLYRTGDLARWRRDGVLEFLGRADAQVKVRGYRIELAEVEAALLAFPGVAQAVALVREDVPGDKRLVGYVAAPESLDTSALRAFLKQRLPEYMVPSALVRLDTLPLTSNAKVDRKALPAPDAALASSESFVAPRNATEQKLAELFASVLRLSQVSVTGNFFELGGHSLLATQVISRIRSALGVELPLRALFEAPTVAALAERLDSNGAPQRAAPPLIPVPRTGPLPLSFAQQRLWFIAQLEPGSASYSMPTFVRLEGALDADALRRALDELASRHEALRTTFTQQEDQPVQRISPTGTLPLETVDLSGLAPQAARAELERRLRDELLRPFNLTTGPLVRAQLLKLGAAEHVLALNMHHIVSDGWSMGVLVREVAALYEAFSQGTPSPLPPLPLQYADYAVWQRGWLQGAVLDEQLGWWRKQLSGLSTLELPTDKPRPPVQTFHGAHLPLVLSRSASEALKALCQREGATPFMALLAAFQVLLSRYSGQRDIAVGSPIAGRQRGELEGLIGFFVNTLVLRAHVEDHASFLDLLHQVRESSLGAFAHQDIPFERLVEELQPTRDMSRSPLFQVIFSLQNAPMPAVRKQALSLSPVEVENPTIKFELQLSLTDSPEGYQGSLSYNTDLFEHATALRMTSHFQVLVEALTSRPEAPLASVSMLSPAERKQVLLEWSATASEYPRDATLPQVFSQVVARHADNVAVEFSGSKLTYRQLDERANQLAHHLRGLGVTTDARVALAVERSLELIVSLVAILKAGAAYVPLDPSYPRERLAAMVEDVRPGVLVTTRSLLPKLPGEGLRTVVLEEAALASEPTHAPPPSALPDSLAYVDFTSGSTGKPKGVGTTHRGVLRTLIGVDYARFGPEETLLHFAPISFDASTFEIWGALLHGARLVVMPPQVPSLEELGHVLQSSGVTTLWATVGLFTQLVDNPPPGLSSVKHVMTGGDVVSPAHVRRAVEALRLPVTAFYGPTETTVFATSFPVTRPEQVGSSVPIGKPIGCTRVYVLDAHGQPVPVGVTGELFIGGDGLARGYVGQPELTAERFVPDTFSGEPGARLYRTGDLVRWRADGVLD